MVNAFAPRPEFQAPGNYVKANDGEWHLVPSKLPPLCEYSALALPLARTHRALEALRDGSPQAGDLPEPDEIKAGRWTIRTSAPTDTPRPEEDQNAMIMVVSGARRPVIEPAQNVDPLPSRATGFTPWLCATHLKVAAVSKVALPHGELRRGESAIASNKEYRGIMLNAAPSFRVQRSLDELAEFIYYDKDVDPVIAAILARMQFILIHPFADGNGRTACILFEEVLRFRGLLGSKKLPIRQVADFNYPELSAVSHNVVRWGAWREYVELWLGITEAACAISFRQ